MARAVSVKCRAAAMESRGAGVESGEGGHSTGSHESAPPSVLRSQTVSVTSREFNQDVGKAKRAAEYGPVTITDRGRPAFVLMKHEDYLRLSGGTKSLVDMLADDRPEADFDFEFPRLSGDWGLRIPDFSED
jgi:prevent-host-death family protein